MHFRLFATQENKNNSSPHRMTSIADWSEFFYKMKPEDNIKFSLKVKLEGWRHFGLFVCCCMWSHTLVFDCDEASKIVENEIEVFSKKSLWYFLLFVVRSQFVRSTLMSHLLLQLLDQRLTQLLDQLLLWQLPRELTRWSTMGTMYSYSQRSSHICWEQWTQARKPPMN